MFTEMLCSFINVGTDDCYVRYAFIRRDRNRQVFFRIGVTLVVTQSGYSLHCSTAQERSFNTNLIVDPKRSIDRHDERESEL